VGVARGQPPLAGDDGHVRRRHRARAHHGRPRRRSHGVAG
jgi:hypothetical protein